MVARSVHTFCKWLPPAVFGGLGTIAGLAIGASQVWSRARTWSEARWQEICVVTAWPLAWVGFGALIAIWLAAFIWSGKRLSSPMPNSPKISLNDAEAICRDGGLWDVPNGAYMELFIRTAVKEGKLQAWSDASGMHQVKVLSTNPIFVDADQIRVWAGPKPAPGIHAAIISHSSGINFNNYKARGINNGPSVHFSNDCDFNDLDFDFEKSND